MLTDEQRDKKRALLANQAKLLMEHFDSIQIFATSYEKETGGTTHWSEGYGNWCARYGHVKSWVQITDEALSEEGRKN